MSWIAVGTIAASAGSAAYSANQQKKQAKDAAAAVEGNQVKPPNATQAARRAWIEQYNLAPMVARQDQRIRNEMAPQQAQLASDLYAKFFPQMAATNLATLRKVDPESIDGRKALYGTVFDELQQGRGMSAETQRQITQAARGALAARGNNLGNAAALAEATNYGQAGDAALQQRIANMGNFLRGPTPESHFGELAGAAGPSISAVTTGAASPGNEYVEGPSYWKTAEDNAWRQYQAQAANGKQLGAVQGAAAASQENPWMAALGSAAGTAVQGYNSGAFRKPTAPNKAVQSEAITKV